MPVPAAPAALLAETAARLAAAGARDEALARLVERRLLGIPRGQAFESLERVWRLGVLLLGRSGALYATGHTIRIDTPRFDNHQSNLAAERRAVRELALKSGVAPGDTLNWGAQPLAVPGAETSRPPDPAGGPLVRRDGRLLVRWMPADPTALVPFEPYIAERAGLLLDPPGGA